MALDTFKIFDEFVDDMPDGQHDGLISGADELRIALTNSAPDGTEANWNLTDFPAPAAANGYPSGGNNSTSHFTYTASATTGTFTLALTSDCVFSATAGGIGPIRYAIFYNSDSASPTNAAIGWVDHGTAITINNNETYTISSGTVCTIVRTNP